MSDPLFGLLACWTLRRNYDYFWGGRIRNGVIRHDFQTAAGLNRFLVFSYRVEVEWSISTRWQIYVLENLPRPGKIDDYCTIGNEKCNRNAALRGWYQWIGNGRALSGTIRWSCVVDGSERLARKRESARCCQAQGRRSLKHFSSIDHYVSVSPCIEILA